LADQSCAVHIFDADRGQTTEVYRTRNLLLEAPNWAWPDRLLLNGDGLLCTLGLNSGELLQLDIPGLPFVNNDHVPAPDGDTVYVSCYDWRIYGLSLSTRRFWPVSHPDPDRPLRHFLHGVSPDGTELAFVGVAPGPHGPWGAANIYAMNAHGGDLRQLPYGDKPADGCEYSPDGDWIFFQHRALQRHAGPCADRADEAGRFGA
jgi:hypothetical protein